MGLTGWTGWTVTILVSPSCTCRTNFKKIKSSQHERTGFQIPNESSGYSQPSSRSRAGNRQNHHHARLETLTPDEQSTEATVAVPKRACFDFMDLGGKSQCVVVVEWVGVEV
jgi:hypothetical protein